MVEKIEELNPPTNLILSTLPSTIKYAETTIPQIITTIPKIETTIPKIDTTIPKIEKIQPIQTTPSFVCPLEKCEECNQESASKNLCIKCNKSKQYYEIAAHIDYNSNFNKYKDYIECFNNSTKPPNFYLNN